MQDRVKSRAVPGGERRAERRRELDGLFLEAFPPEKRREILENLAEKAKAGDVRVAAFLFDRCYGRPGASVSPEDNAEADMQRFDMSRLDDREMEVFAALLEKGVARDDPPADDDRGEEGHRPPALPPGPGRICEGGAEGKVVAPAGRRRGSAAKT